MEQSSNDRGSPSEPARRGRVLIVSGPSGSGKSTIIAQFLRETALPVQFSVSATSRAPRPGEREAEHYYFLTRHDFEEMREQGKLLEWAQVHGNLYGTPREAVERLLDQGTWVLLDIDIQGHRQVKEAMPEAVSFFVRLPSLQGYEERLRARATESERELSQRLADVRSQLEQAGDYDFQIVNDKVSQAVRTLETLLCGLRYIEEH